MLLGQWNIVQSDLLPILQTYHDHHDLVIAASTCLPANPSQRAVYNSTVSVNQAVSPVSSSTGCVVSAPNAR
jgi:hypothetical protein